jgi:hypothetical protein
MKHRTNMKIIFNKVWYLAMLIMAIGSTSLVHADSWGIKFLGKTTSTNLNYNTVPPDLVTNTAGFVPISGWNNITNYSDTTQQPYTTGTIHSSDSNSTATLTISGSVAGNPAIGGWASGTPADGGDGSLADGYLDLGANINNPGGTIHSETNVISGLPGTNYTLYVYIYSDASHPGNGGDYLPNYSANGITYYAPQFGNGQTTYDANTNGVGGAFTGWKKAKATLANYNTRVVSTNDFGNFLEIDNVIPKQPGGVITFVGQADNQSWRSPLDGFEVVLNTNAVAPSIDAQTASSTNFAGSTVQVQVVANGTPLNFQWQAGAVGSGIYTNLNNGGQFSGVNSATLTISNFSPANVGDYIVVITNSAGSATSSAPTTLSVAPMAISGAIPATSQVYPGATALFSVTVQGAQPLTYKWRKNGSPLSDSAGHISGSSTSLLQISNATSGDANSYDCIVTNSFSSITSSPAIFSLAAAPVSGSYAQAITNKAAVAHWRFNETTPDPTTGNAWAYDFIGGHAGAYGASTQNGADGITGPSTPTWPGFESANYALEIFGFNTGSNTGFTNSLVEVPSAFALNLNTNTVTITAWINPATTNAPNLGLVFERQGEVAGLCFGTNGNLGFNWNNAAATYNFDSGLTVPASQWSFVALVVSPTSATLYMDNANGQTNATLAGTYPSLSFADPLDFGTDTQFPDVRAFNGNIDEVAIFNRSLSSLEIAQLYAVGSGGPQPASISIKGSGTSVVLTWTGTLLQSTNVTGPWVTNSAAVSPLTVAPAGPRMFYRAQQ